MNKLEAILPEVLTIIVIGVVAGLSIFHLGDKAAAIVGPLGGGLVGYLTRGITHK